MTAESVIEIKTEPVSSGNDRSTIDFPYIDIDDAVGVAQGVHNAGGWSCAQEQLAASIGMEAKGGAFRLKLNGAKTYCLLTYARGGEINLTELGRRVVNSSTLEAAKIEAFFAVPLYAKAYEEFKGSPLPPPPAIERTLVRLGVGDGVKDRARQVMMRAAKQAGFFSMAADRMTKPNVRGEPEPPIQNVDTVEKPKGNSGGGNDGGGGSGHPLIQGLLLTLPKPGDEWAFEERFNWLNMANSIFKMVYKTTDSDLEVEVKLNKKS